MKEKTTKKKTRGASKKKKVEVISSDPAKTDGRYFFNCKTKTELDEVLNRLRVAWMAGCTTAEACVFAGIHRQSFYKYAEKNPQILEERDEKVLNPKVVAKMAIFKQMSNGDGNLALQYLERVSKEEFSKTIQFSSISDEKLSDDYKSNVMGALEMMGEDVDDDMQRMIEDGTTQEKTNKGLIEGPDSFDKELDEIKNEST